MTRFIFAALLVCALDIVSSKEITLWIAYLVPMGLATSGARPRSCHWRALHRSSLCELAA